MGIRSDYGREFKNKIFQANCEEHEITQNFSAPRIPQQNEVVERKNRTLQEIDGTLLAENQLPKTCGLKL